MTEIVEEPYLQLIRDILDHGHMKDEIDLSNCNTIEDVKKVIDDYIDYYNNDRYQWDLAKLSPSEYYKYTMTGDYPLKKD